MHLPFEDPLFLEKIYAMFRKAFEAGAFEGNFNEDSRLFEIGGYFKYEIELEEEYAKREEFARDWNFALAQLIAEKEKKLNAAFYGQEGRPGISWESKLAYDCILKGDNAPLSKFLFSIFMIYYRDYEDNGLTMPKIEEIPTDPLFIAQVNSAIRNIGLGVALAYTIPDWKKKHQELNKSTPPTGTPKNQPKKFTTLKEVFHEPHLYENAIDALRKLKFIDINNENLIGSELKGVISLWVNILRYDRHLLKYVSDKYLTVLLNNEFKYLNLSEKSDGKTLRTKIGETVSERYRAKLLALI